MNIKKISDYCYYSPSIKSIVESRDIEVDWDELKEYIKENEQMNTGEVFTNPNNWLPVRISLFTSISCNMRCSYCYYCSEDNNEKDLSIEELKILIDFLVRNARIRRMAGKENTITVTLTGGGEPTYNWNNFTFFIDALKQKASEYNIETCFYLVTNGVLSESKIEYICKNIDYIQISYDGNAELQNANRKLANGSNSATLVENTMYLLSKYKKNFQVRTTLKPNDFSKIPDMANKILGDYEYAVSYDIEPVQYVGRGETAERGSEYNDNVLIQEYIKTKREMLGKYPQKRFSCSLFEYTDICVPCSNLTGATPVINNRGMLYPCAVKLDPDTQSLGNIENGKVKIKRSSFYEEIYKKMLKTQCGQCAFFSLCGGGCISTFKRNEEGELLPEGKAKCELRIKYWEHAFKELANKHVFLDMRLEKKKSLKKWHIYDIKVDNE